MLVKNNTGKICICSTSMPTYTNNDFSNLIYKFDYIQLFSQTILLENILVYNLLTSFKN